MDDIENHPSWLALREELRRLVNGSHAACAYVLDGWGNLWCSSENTYKTELLAAVGLCEAALRRLNRPLTRGGTIDQFFDHMRRRGYLRSFAGVYVVLIIWTPRFGEPTPLARDLVARALPRIEALTLALPPPEGPGSGSAEGFGVA